jgi:hypothetical protein
LIIFYTCPSHLWNRFHLTVNKLSGKFAIDTLIQKKLHALGHHANKLFFCFFQQGDDLLFSHCWESI